MSTCYILILGSGLSLSGYCFLYSSIHMQNSKCPLTNSLVAILRGRLKPSQMGHSQTQPEQSILVNPQAYSKAYLYNPAGSHSESCEKLYKSGYYQFDIRDLWVYYIILLLFIFSYSFLRLSFLGICTLHRCQAIFFHRTIIFLLFKMENLP